MIRYNNLGSAVYAKEKLNGFEYPPGNRLSVTYIDDGEDRTRLVAFNQTPSYTVCQCLKTPAHLFPLK